MNQAAFTRCTFVTRAATDESANVSLRDPQDDIFENMGGIMRGWGNSSDLVER